MPPPLPPPPVTSPLPRCRELTHLLRQPAGLQPLISLLHQDLHRLPPGKRAAPLTVPTLSLHSCQNGEKRKKKKGTSLYMYTATSRDPRSKVCSLVFPAPCPENSPIQGSKPAVQFWVREGARGGCAEQQRALSPVPLPSCVSGVQEGSPWRP